mgnify:CR=1 FL=1
MSKYGAFDVVRTERLKCKRVNDPHADEEGMREYSYLKCPHCNNEVIEIASSTMERQKFAVIRDHMLICPSFTGERPPKRGKAAANIASDDDEACVLAKLKSELEAMKRMYERENEEMTRKVEGQQKEIKELEDKMSRYDDIFMPKQPDTTDQTTQTPNEWEKPNTTSPFFSHFATRIQDENAKLRAQIRDLQTQLGNSGGVLV